MRQRKITKALSLEGSVDGWSHFMPLEEGKESPHVVNAGGVMAGIADDGAFFSSADSFAIIRGGHVDVTVLGSLQVDEKGNIANYKIPGKCCLVWEAPWIWW